eukprot:4715207-Prymnesium_polylepis.1
MHQSVRQQNLGSAARRSAGNDLSWAQTHRCARHCGRLRVVDKVHGGREMAGNQWLVDNLVVPVTEHT